MDKSQIRKEYKIIRNSLSMQFCEQASHTVANLIRELPPFKNASCIMAYSAFGSEISAAPIIASAFEDGKTVLLPVSDKNSNKMYGAKILSQNELVQGAYGIDEPIDKKKYTSDIDIVIVPGLAFNKRGYRVGYGKGYYDAFFAKEKNMLKIGICFSCQVLDLDFEDDFDINVDMIVTEKGVIACEKN